MLGKEWTREFFDEYVIWLEHTLFKILFENGEKELQENIEVADISASQETVNDSNETHNDKESNNQEIITFIRNKLNSFETVLKDEFIEYFLQSNNNKRYPERAFLFDVNYIDDCNMNNFYFSLLEKDGKIIIDQNDKIKGLKLLLSEFLYQCGYNDALKIQEGLLIKNKEKIKRIKKNSYEIMSDKKIFKNVKIEYKNGTSENVTIFYGKIRENTTWYIKTQNKLYRKITRNKSGEYICGEGKSRVVIKDKDIVEYISKDYN